MQNKMTDQIILKSVGSYIQTDGVVGPLMFNGLPDLTNSTHLEDVNESWLEALSPEDMQVVREINKDVRGTTELPINGR